MSQKYSARDNRDFAVSIAFALVPAILIGNIFEFFVGYLTFLGILVPAYLLLVSVGTKKLKVAKFVAGGGLILNTIFVIYASTELMTTMSFVFTIFFVLEFILMALIVEKISG